MAGRIHSILSGLLEAVHFIAFNAWIVAAVGIPASLLLRSYGTLLFIVVLVAFWQIVWALLSTVLPVAGTGTRTRLRYRLTPWGLVYCGIAALFCFLSVSWGLNLVYLTTSFLLAGLLCAAVFPGFLLARTATEWSLPTHVFAGTPFSFEVKVSNRKRLLSAFGLNVETNGRGSAESADWRHIPRLGPGREHTLVLREHLPERGAHPMPPLVIRSSFPFGLVEVLLEAQHGDKVLVFPRLGHIRRERLLRYEGHEARWLRNLRQMDPQNEFRSLREYQYGDNPRHIHWPTTARLGKLHVREFERQETQGVLILLDCYAPPETPAEAEARSVRFEKAVSFVATLASLLTERNIFYAFASFCPDLVLMHYDCGAGHFYSLLEALALAQPTSEHTLADLMGALSFRDFIAAGACVVTPGPLPLEQRSAVLGPLSHNSASMDVSTPEFNEIFGL